MDSPGLVSADVPVRLPGEGHAMVFGPTGAGKGIASVIPALLQHPGPVIVVGPKSENSDVTARRRRELGQRTVVIDPMGITRGSAGAFNPLDLMDLESDSLVDDVASLVETLAANSGQDARDRFWSQRASHLVIGVVLYVLHECPAPERHLGTVRKLIEEAAGQPQQLAKRMAQCSCAEVRLTANTLLIGADTTLGGIMAFAQSMLEFLRGERVLRSIEKTSFKLDAVTRGDPLSIYFVMPPHMLGSHGRLLRLWLSGLMSCIVRRRGRPAHNTLLLLDEAASVGLLPQYRDAVVLMRGYGLQTISYWQDMSQLKAVYDRDWKALINNCRVLQFLGVPNLAAANDIVDAIGWRVGAAEDLLDMKPGQMLLQVAGQVPCIARSLDYRSEETFAGLFDPNPYHMPGGSVMPRKKRRKAAPEAEPANPIPLKVVAAKCTGLHRLLSG